MTMDKHSDFVVHAYLPDHRACRRSWPHATLPYPSFDRFDNGEDEDEQQQPQEIAGGDGEDRLSALPDSICQQIVSLLPATDARRTAFLSRRWRHIWCGTPSFHFDEREFHGRPLPLLQRYRSRLKFIKFVEDTMEFRRKFFDDLSVHEFKVSMRFFEELAPHLDRWIEFALEKNVKELSIIAEMKDLIAIAEFFQPFRLPYQLPNAVFSTKSLQSLELVFCDLNQVSVPSIHLPSLKNLEMINVRLSDSILQGILSSSPLLEKLSLSLVCGLNKIQISNQHLKMLVLLKCSPLQESLIRAPNLESLLFRGKRHSSDKINISSCRQLKFLWLQRATNLTDESLQTITHQNPNLEVMILSHCSALKNAVIKSPKLWMFVVFKCKHLSHLKIDAPSLTAFEYSGHMITFPSVASSPHLDAVVHMDGGEISSRWYTKLKDMCAKFEGCRKLWIRCEHDVDLIIPPEMRTRLQPQLRGLKELKIHVRSGIINVPVLEDGIKWIFPGLNNLYIESDGSTHHFCYSGERRDDAGVDLRGRKCRSFIEAE